MAISPIKVSADAKYGDGTLAKFAEKIGVGYATMRDYLATAKAWPQSVDRSTNWTVARVLATHPDRVEIAIDALSVIVVALSTMLAIAA